MVRVRVRVPRGTKPTAPGALELAKSCQREHGPSRTSLLPHLSTLCHLCSWRTQFKDQGAARVMVRVLKATEPYSSRDNGDAKGLPKGSWLCTYITTPTPSSSEHPWCWGPEPKFLAAIGVKVLRTTKRTAPGTLGLQRECQWVHGSTPILLLPHLSHLGRSCCWRPPFKDQATIRVRVRARVPRTIKSKAPGIPGLQQSCQEEHGTAPTLLPL